MSLWKPVLRRRGDPSTLNRCDIYTSSCPITMPSTLYGHIMSGSTFAIATDNVSPIILASSIVFLFVIIALLNLF